MRPFAALFLLLLPIAAALKAPAEASFDALSNIRTRNEGTSTATIAYASGNRSAGCVRFANGPASPSATVNGAARTFAYDARGNATDNGPVGFLYDFANQPTRTLNSSGGTIADYVYDGNLKRVKEVRAGKTIYTIYSKATGGPLPWPSPPKFDPPDRIFSLRLTGSEVYRDQATDNIKTDYSSAGGAAVRLKKTGTGAFVPEYTHFDSQGSAVAASDAAGAVTWREVYAPFGEERLNPAANNDNTAYTGHLKDDATGLNYMQARYYDPLVGRFLSTDPIGYQDQLNLYAYVHNDPVNMVDPNGEDAEVAIRRNEFHSFVQITNKENRLQTAIVRGGPNRNYSGAISGRSSGSGSGASRGSSSSGSPGATTGSNAGGDSGDRASGSSSGDAGGSGRLQLVGQVSDIAGSIDSAAALDPKTVEVGSTTVSGDFSDVVGAAEAFTNTVNDAGLPYQVLDQNSNSFAGTAYEQITGETRPDNNSGGILPGYNKDLCQETKC